MSATAGHPPYRLQLIGGFRLLRRGLPVTISPSAQRLLAYVALQLGPVTRDRVATALWLEKSDERARANLRSALWRVGQGADGVLVSQGEMIAVAEGVEVDVRTLEAQAQAVLAGSEPPPSFESPLFADELLPNWFDEWVLSERERLRQTRLHALEAMAELMLRRADYASALDMALSAVRAEPLRETSNRLVVTIHVAEGNPSEARRAYERFRRQLWEEMGLRPSRRIRSIIQVDAQLDDSLTVATGDDAVTTS
jgi:DNA-binding SARP family transcriptional activator